MRLGEDREGWVKLGKASHGWVRMERLGEGRERLYGGGGRMGNVG